MKKLIFIWLHFVCFFVYSQDSHTQIEKNISIIEKAFIEKDNVVLNEFLHPDLTLGHSNAWIETKTTLLKDLKNTKVSYVSFEKLSEIDFTFSSDEMIITRRNIRVRGEFEQHDFTVKINVLEVWKLHKKVWKLLARQSVTIMK